MTQFRLEVNSNRICCFFGQVIPVKVWHLLPRHLKQNPVDIAWIILCRYYAQRREARGGTKIPFSCEPKAFFYSDDSSWDGNGCFVFVRWCWLPSGMGRCVHCKTKNGPYVEMMLPYIVGDEVTYTHDTTHWSIQNQIYIQNLLCHCPLLIVISVSGRLTSLALIDIDAHGVKSEEHSFQSPGSS